MATKWCLLLDAFAATLQNAGSVYLLAESISVFIF
jgi:hypothetical protein